MLYSREVYKLRYNTNMVQRLLLLQLLLFASGFVSSMNSPRSSLALYDFKVSSELMGGFKRPIIEDRISNDKKCDNFEDYDPFFTLGIDFDGTLFYMEKSSNSKISLQKTIWVLAKDTKPFDLSGYSYGFSNLFIIGFIHKNIINAQNIESSNQEDQMLFEREAFSIISLEKSSGEYKWNITYSQYTSKEENSYCYDTIDREKISGIWNFKLDIKEENSLKQRLFEYFEHHWWNYCNSSKTFQILCSAVCDLIEFCNDNLGILVMITLAASLGFLLGRKSQISSCPSSRSSSEDPIDCQIHHHAPKNCSESFTDGVLPIKIPVTEDIELEKLKSSTESISPIAKVRASAPEKNYFEFDKKDITPFEINKDILISPIEMAANYKHKAILTLREFENLEDSDMEISQDPIKEIKRTLIEDENSSEDELGVKEYWDSPQRSKKRISVTRLPQKNGEFQELIEVLDDGNYNRKFEFQNILGYGGFSSVHLAKHKLDGQLYAIKIVKMKIGVSQSITRHRLFAEVNLLKKLHSKYLVQYITCWAERELNKIQEEDEDSDASRFALSSDMSSEISSFLDEKYMSVLLHIQMEYCSGMCLHDFLENDKRIIDRKVNYNLLVQILKGIKHIHDKGIIHRDLKPANIFLDGGNNVKIGDFNLATALEQSEKSSQSYLDMQELSSNIGTPLYLAPEQEKTHKYNHKADIFPIGIILLELYTKFGTFHEKISILKKIRECGEIPEGFKREYPIESELVRLMTSLNPKNRPNARELLNCQLLKMWKSELKI